MPTIYLSPSTQPYNLYATGGSEQDWMNLLTDYLEPQLTAMGIQHVRKALNMTAADAIRQSNAGNYDLHVALHSNAAPDALSGQLRGIIVFYYPGSAEGLRAATILADNLKNIYPLPDRVRTEPSTSIGELRQVRAPSAFLEIGYHDNVSDSLWIQENIPLIAENIAGSLAEYFGIPTLAPSAPINGIVELTWGNLNVRERPDVNSPILATISDGTIVSILNTYENWYLIQFGNVMGYASRDYIVPLGR